MELNAEQIIKALECCAKGCCGDCPRFPSSLGCCRKIMLDALALIKELTEEKEKLGKAFDDLLKEAETYLKQRDALQNRVKYLEKENARLVEDNHILSTEFKETIKSDTVRKMQERLKGYLLLTESGDLSVVSADDIDQIAKEMLEGGDGIQDN